MIKVSNVLFVLFLICFTTSKQLQGQVARLPLKESKQKIAELINEMIPKETREALEKEGLLEKNFTKEVFSTVVDFSIWLSASFAEVLASPSICELLAVDFDATIAEEFLSEEVVFVFSLL